MVSVIQAINDDNKKDELKQNAEIQIVKIYFIRYLIERILLLMTEKK